MVTLLIDPGLFEVPEGISREEEIEHYFFLKNSIEYASRYFDVILNDYDGAPYGFWNGGTFSRPPLTRSHYIRTHYVNLQAEIRKMAKNGTQVKLEEDTIDSCSLSFCNHSNTEIPFKKYLFTLFFSGKYSYDQAVVLLAKHNECCSPTIRLIRGDSIDITAVSNPATDCNGIVHQFLARTDLMEEPFPQQYACEYLNNAFLNESKKSGLNNNNKRSLFIKFGNETASRNYYSQKSDISRKNPNYEVFVHRNGNYYLSIDLEHGGLEVFRKHGNHPIHLGEYDYSCAQIKSSELETHRLNV